MKKAQLEKMLEEAQETIAMLQSRRWVSIKYCTLVVPAGGVGIRVSDAHGVEISCCTIVRPPHRRWALKHWWQFARFWAQLGANNDLASMTGVSTR